MMDSLRWDDQYHFDSFFPCLTRQQYLVYLYIQVRQIHLKVLNQFLSLHPDWQQGGAWGGERTTFQHLCSPFGFWIWAHLLLTTVGSPPFHLKTEPCSHTFKVKTSLKWQDIWILNYFLWLHIKQVLLPCCPVPVLISLVGPVSFPRLPPWVSLHSPCHMAHFFLPKALANSFLWDKWLRPCYPFTDLFPSAWSCECCPIQSLPCHWEGITIRTHVLKCFFIWDHLSELSARIVLCYCCALPGHHALPSAWTSSSHSYNQISSWALVLSP